MMLQWQRRSLDLHPCHVSPEWKPDDMAFVILTESDLVLELSHQSVT